MDRKQNKKEYKRSRSRSEKRKKKEKKKRNKDKKRKDKSSKKSSNRRHSGSRSSSESNNNSNKSSRSNSNQPTQQEETKNQIKIIPISVNLPLLKQQTTANTTNNTTNNNNTLNNGLDSLLGINSTTNTTTQSQNPTTNIPSSILSFVNKAQQNIEQTLSTAAGSNANGANPLREKRKAFSSPPKNNNTGFNGFSNPTANNTIIPGLGNAINGNNGGLILPGQGSMNGGLEIPGLPGFVSQTNGGNMLDISLQGLSGLLPQDTQIIGNKIPPAMHKQYIHALRVYIGNIPDPVDVDDVCNFVFSQMANAGGILEPGTPILSKKHDPIKKFIFLQLRSIEETTACMELDGIIYRGKSLRFRRPKDFGVLQKVEGTRPVPHLDRSKLKIVQTQVENTYNKLQIMNLPETFSEEHVMNLLLTYGDLKSFHLAVDKITSESKGFAFCEFITDRSTVECLNKLSGQTITNKVLNVKRCNPSLAPAQEDPIYTLEQLYKFLIDNVNKTVIESGQKDVQEDYLKKMLSINVPKYDGLIQEDATNILKIHNIVNKQLIEEDTEYQLVFNDLKSQLDKIGKVKSIVIPRKKEKYSEGIGYVFVEFDNERISQVAAYLLQRLKYDGKEVRTEFYSPQYYADKTFF